MLGGKYGRIVLKNKLCANLSSDRMCPHFDGKYNLKCNDWLTKFEIEELKEKVRTIGGHILFPAHKKNGFTINQARGISKKICDRFDLTLECIRRLYLNETSPLYDTLLNYEDFFKQHFAKKLKPQSFQNQGIALFFLYFSQVRGLSRTLK